MISILLATYNGEKFIKESIDSVVNQTFTEWELLIGFNGTTDNTRKIVESYDDPRIKTFDYKDDKGKSKTLNKLILQSSYEWIAIQDDDDVWVKDKLESQIKFLNEYDIIGSKISYIDENGNPKGYPKIHTDHSKIVELSLRGDNQIPNTSAIFKKKDALDIGGWVSDLDGIEDFDFWLKLIRLGKKVMNVDKRLVLHRLHAKSNFNTKKHDLNKIL
jgi:glycosyltransferase involved in cell wall biosynthesis